MAFGDVTIAAFGDALREVDAKILRVADWVAQRIRTRTREGRSMTGGGWNRPTYSKYWGRKRGKSSPVDLYAYNVEDKRYDTHMLDTFAVSETDFHHESSGRGSQFRDPATGRYAKRTQMQLVMTVAPEHEGKAFAHQFGRGGRGGKYGGGGVNPSYPMRPFMGLTSDEEAEIAEDIGAAFGVLSPTEEVFDMKVRLG